MAADYKQLLDPITGGISSTVLRVVDQAYIPDDPANVDFQRYSAWLAEGNTPDPPAPPSRAGVIARSTQANALATAQQLNATGRTQEAVAAILDMMETRT